MDVFTSGIPSSDPIVLAVHTSIIGDPIDPYAIGLIDTPPVTAAGAEPDETRRGNPRKPVGLSTVDEIFSSPYHPYARALLSSISVSDPSAANTAVRIEGTVPSARRRPSRELKDRRQLTFLLADPKFIQATTIADRGCIIYGKIEFEVSPHELKENAMVKKY